MSQPRVIRALCAFFLVAAGACGDDLPTSVDPDRFPAHARLASFTVELPASEFLEHFGHFDGYSSRRNLPYLIAANRFDEGLSARILMRTVNWPESISGDTAFAHVRGQLIMTVDTIGSVADHGSMVLRLFALTQPWHEGSVSWEMAVDTAGGEQAWEVPGGSLGVPLSSAVWTPTAEAPDSISWPLDSLAIATMSDPEFPGVAVVAEGLPGRLQAVGFEVRTEVRLSTRPDTLQDHSIPGGEGAFIFDAPAGPPADPGWLIGGLTSARALFRVTLPESLPACPSASAGCPRVPISEANLNDVSLILTPLAVEDGFGEVSPVTVRVRLVGAPELGRNAPLGPVPLATPGLASQVQTRRNLFRAPPADTTVAMRVTEEVVRRVSQPGSEPVVLPLALLAEPEGSYFGYTRFASEPRLRIVYTLPVGNTVP